MTLPLVPDAQPTLRSSTDRALDFYSSSCAFESRRRDLIVSCCVMKLCPRCGQENDTVQGTCRDCYNEYMRTYLIGRWKKRKARGIQLLGGVCVDCGGTTNLEFDHIDPSLKEFTLSSRPFCSEEKFLRELAKCVLRCADPCHRNRSAEQRRIDHGSGTGRRDCSCEPCKTRTTEYMKEYRKRRKH